MERMLSRAVEVRLSLRLVIRWENVLGDGRGRPEIMRGGRGLPVTAGDGTSDVP